MAAGQGFTIGAMRPVEYDQCVDIACDAFMTDNPAVVALKIPREVWRDFVKAHVSRQSAVDTGLSLIARGEYGNPLAFLFLHAFDIRDQPPDEVFQQHEGLQCMKEMIEKLYERAMTSPVKGLRLASLLSGKALYAAMGGTFPDASGQGLGKALRLRAVEVAKERGFSTLLVEPGHGATRHIWTQHCHGVIRAEMAFRSFKSKGGQYPLKDVDGTISICEVVIHKSFADSAFFWPLSFAKLIWLTTCAKPRRAA